jgi:hypothetical protein
MTSQKREYPLLLFTVQNMFYVSSAFYRALVVLFVEDKRVWALMSSQLIISVMEMDFCDDTKITGRQFCVAFRFLSLFNGPPFVRMQITISSTEQSLVCDTLVLNELSYRW